LLAQQGLMELRLVAIPTTAEQQDWLGLQALLAVAALVGVPNGMQRTSQRLQSALVLADTALGLAVDLLEPMRPQQGQWL
jgi:hypothetical protein